MKIKSHGKQASTTTELKLTLGQLGSDSEIPSVAIRASLKRRPPAYKPDYKGILEDRLVKVARRVIDSSASERVARALKRFRNLPQTAR
jgi:hypothetical protein